MKIKLLVILLLFSLTSYSQLVAKKLLYGQLEITEDTRIEIYFDNSESMTSTYNELIWMRDNVLKAELLPIYNNNESLYDEKVTVRTIIDELTFMSLDPGATYPEEGEIVILLFQDEAFSSYHNAPFDGALKTPYEENILVYNSRLDYIRNNYGRNFYRAVIFAVEGDEYADAFADFIDAVRLGTGNFTGNYGLSNRTEIGYEFNVTAGVSHTTDPDYYLDLILNALRDLGFDI